MRLALINPNTTSATTDSMVRIARDAAAEVEIVGVTAMVGAPLITRPETLATAVDAVIDLAPRVRALEPHGVIVSAFGDPGLTQLRSHLRCPVTGIAEAAMASAARRATRFAVVTITPLLVPAIARAAASYGHREQFWGTVVTDGDPDELLADVETLEAALDVACRRAITELGVGAIIIGGGPLGVVAQGLRGRFDASIIEPIPEAVALAIRRAGVDNDSGTLEP